MTNLARMSNARELYTPGFVSVTHGVGPPSGFSSDVLRLAFTIYTDRELDDLGVFSYGRSIPTVDGQLAKLREGHVDEPTMGSAPFGEWWQLAGDIAFDALTGPITRLLCQDSLSAVLRPKPEGIVQASGCGAYPSYFSKPSEGFGTAPKKSDSIVVAWCTETALSVIRNFNNSGRLDFRGRSTLTSLLQTKTLIKRW